MKLRYDWFDPEGPVANGFPHNLEFNKRNQGQHATYYQTPTNVYVGEFIKFLHYIDLPRKILPLYGKRDEDRYFALVEPLGVPKRLLGQYAHHKPFLQSFSKRLLTDIRSGSAHLLIYYAHEGFDLYKEEFFPGLFKLLKKFGIDPTHVTMVSGNLIERKGYQRWIEEEGIEQPFRMVEYNHFWLLSLLNYRYYKYDHPEQKKEYFACLEDQLTSMGMKQKKYKYLCLNRLPKPFRMAFVSYLEHADLLDKGLVSFPKLDKKDYSSDFGPLFPDTSSLYSALQESEQRILSKLPMQVDTSDFARNKAYSNSDNGRSDYAWPYLDSYFSIVNESWVNEGSLLISEKSFKPMINHHPFIIMGNPGTLRQLRKMGFKSFSPWIDESYDDEPNFVKRMQMVIGEVKNLCDMSDEALNQWYKQLLPILKHNHQHFYSDQAELEFRTLVQKFDEFHPTDDLLRSKMESGINSHSLI